MFSYLPGFVLPDYCWFTGALNYHAYHVMSLYLPIGETGPRAQATAVLILACAWTELLETFYRSSIPLASPSMSSQWRVVFGIGLLLWSPVVALGRANE